MNKSIKVSLFSLGMLFLNTKTEATLSVSSCDDLSWTNAESFGSSLICSESEVLTCQGLNTWNDANNACLNIGARLCTYNELLNNEARGTGCGLDPALVWSSTNCSSNGYEISYGGSAAGVYSNCTSGTQLSNVRCCADVFVSATLNTTSSPVPAPTQAPTQEPTQTLSQTPSQLPTFMPTFMPTSGVTVPLVSTPTSFPTPFPTSTPTIAPTSTPTSSPSFYPTLSPNNTYSPTALPSSSPTTLPSSSPTPMPSLSPTPLPTSQPTFKPTYLPTVQTTSQLRGSSSKSDDDYNPIDLFGESTSITVAGIAIFLLLFVFIILCLRTLCKKKDVEADIVSKQ